MGADWNDEFLGYSDSDVLIAQAELAKAGVSNEDIKNGALSATLVLAAYSELSTDECSRITAEALERFKNIVAEELPDVVLLANEQSD